MQVPLPQEVEQAEVLPLEVFARLLRSWRNHWADVERIARDFPEDVKKQTLLRPPDPTEALAETRAQFAVLFHPEAIEAFTSYLDIAVRTVETMLEKEYEAAPKADATDSQNDSLGQSLARLDERLEALDVLVTRMLACSQTSD